MRRGGHQFPGIGQGRWWRRRQVLEKQSAWRGPANAFSEYKHTNAMKIPFLIFLISGIATLQIEPVATRGAIMISSYVRQEWRLHLKPAGQTRDVKIDCLREELADVQLDLMKVLETDSAQARELEAREASLKYALRAEQVRRDEIIQCQREDRRRAGQLTPAPVQMAERCVAAPAGKPQS